MPGKPSFNAKARSRKGRRRQIFFGFKLKARILTA
jgi:hypothetical protein